MKFNNKLFALAAFLLYTLGFTASAGLDIKYHKKIADQVWSMSDPTFNPAVRIPDSVAAENSAVIISWADDIDVEHDVQNTIYTLSGLTNRIKRVNISRKMIKLFDQSAIDRYSEFEFGEKEQLKIMERLLIYDLQTSFGARIHKPDGRIIEVNLADAIETGDGKKGKDNKTYKIAIPGLEPGDVFEYFRYKEVMAESMSLDPQDFSVSDKYPVLNRRIELSVNPEMTVEYKCYNSVPDLVREPNGDRRAASLHLTDIPAVNFSKYVMEYRQLPFLRVQYLNNTQREYLSVNSRRGGLYGNIFPEKILSELRDYMSEKKTNNTVAGKAIKIVKDNYLKANPEASKREIADAAWLALLYQDQTGKSDDETSSGQFERALIFGDILRRLKLYGDEEIGLGVINPRNDVPTGEISAWDESRFVVRTPDGIYFMPQNLSLAPGEMPGHYQGETAALYFGDRKTWTNKTLANEYKVPQLKASDNGFVSTDTVTISDDKVIVNSVLKLTGGVKSLYAFFTETPEWTAEVEDYFNIPDNKRYRDKSYDRAGRTTELEKTIKESGKTHYGTTPEKVTDAKVLTRGVRPDAPEMILSYTLEFGGLVESLGDDLNFKIGQLSGVPEMLPENERNRLLDVMLPFINQESHNLVVKAPEGYKFDEASVEALARNISDVTAQFVASPKINENGDLQLKTMLRLKHADLPLTFWPRLLNVLDEAASFGTASVILVKK